MAFCEGGFGKAKKFMNQITEVLHTSMEKITTITGQIKAIEGNLTVEAIVKIIPAGTLYESYLNEAMDLLVKGGSDVVSLADKIANWLEGETDDAKDMKLVKLAQKATAIGDGSKHGQSFYDTAVQVHLEGLK